MKKLMRAGIAALALAASLSASAGAWGEGPFDNDAAQDWLSECAGAAGAAAVVRAIDTALRPGDLDADDGSVAVAAAEVIASVDGRGPSISSAQAKACLAKGLAPEVRALAPRARQALARVSNPSSSELAQLWAEGKSNRWAARISQLGKRLVRQ